MAKTIRLNVISNQKICVALRVKLILVFMIEVFQRNLNSLKNYPVCIKPNCESSCLINQSVPYQTVKTAVLYVVLSKLNIEQMFAIEKKKKKSLSHKS